MWCVQGPRAAFTCLFSSRVVSSKSSRRKQKTGYCLPSSLTRSSFIPRLVSCRKARMLPIFPIIRENKNTLQHRVLGNLLHFIYQSNTYRRFTAEQRQENNTKVAGWLDDQRRRGARLQLLGLRSRSMVPPGAAGLMAAVLAVSPVRGGAAACLSTPEKRDVTALRRQSGLWLL